MNLRTVTAAATAIVGYDLCTNDLNARLPEARVIDGLALTGSASVGDTICELYIGGKLEATFTNTSTGLVMDRSKDLIPQDIYVPPNAQIQAKVIDAATTNPVVLTIEFHKPTRSFSRGRRRFTARRSYAPRAGRTAGMY